MSYGNVIDTISLFVNSSIAILNFCLLFIISKKERSLGKGVKNFSVNINFHPNVTHSDQMFRPELVFEIKNKGLTDQGFCSIETDKGYKLIPGHGDYKEVMKPGEDITLYVPINSNLLENLKNYKHLFLINKLDEKKKISSKKHIKQMLLRCIIYKKKGYLNIHNY